jgi:hypothetical protein
VVTHVISEAAPVARGHEVAVGVGRWRVTPEAVCAQASARSTSAYPSAVSAATAAVYSPSPARRAGAAPATVRAPAS